MSKDIVVKQAGESVTEAMIAKWHKPNGSFVEVDEAVCTLETDKASLDLVAEERGLLQTKFDEGEVVKVGTIIATILPGEKPSAEATATESIKSDQKREISSVKGHPSPSAAKILSEHAINPSAVEGSGKDGRITKQDAMQVVAKSADKASAPENKVIPQSAGIDVIRREKMSMLRRKIAARLVQVKNETAMLTTFNEVDMSAVMEIRNRYKDAFLKKYNVKLGFMSFFAKAAAIAAHSFPVINAQLDGDEIVYYPKMHMGIAVSTEKGLVVPVIRDIDALSFDGFEAKLQELSQKARTSTLSIDEMNGGTFTITNGGVFGSMLSTPIINPPQSAILGMHNIVDRPVVVNGEIKVRPVMYVALSYDHRIIDGKDSVGFLFQIKNILEDPSRFFLHI